MGLWQQECKTTWTVSWIVPTGPCVAAFLLAVVQCFFIFHPQKKRNIFAPHPQTYQDDAPHGAHIFSAGLGSTGDLS